jgi:hypothetical protein
MEKLLSEKRKYSSMKSSMKGFLRHKGFESTYQKTPNKSELIKRITSSPSGVFLASCSSAELASALSTKTNVNLIKDYSKFVNLSKDYQ